MIAATRRWFKRNRTNFVIGAGVIGAGYLAGQYVLGRLKEARQRMTEDRASKENLRKRFELNQEDCTYTVLALLPTIRDEIIGALPVEQITEQLQQERQERLKRLAASEAPSSEYPSAPPSIVDDGSTASYVHASQLVDDRPKRSKAQLWQDMKINSIARALSLLYITALLTLLTRIQLNLLGRRRYLSSVVSMASPPPTHASTISLEDHDISFETVYGNDFETNRMYLTFSWWLLHRGAKSILERVMAAVKDVFGQVNIREDMTIERLSELIIDVRRKIEGATEEERRRRSWLEYLLPPREQEVFVIHQAGLSDGSESVSPEPGHNPLEVDSITPSLRRLLDETADLIDSPTFALVLSHLLDAGFSHLVDVRIASEAFKVSHDGGRVTEIFDTKCKLAHILPVFCRQAHAIVVGSGELDAIAGVAESGPVPNEYLAVMDRVHDLEAFAAVIYSSNFEYEVVDSPRETASLPSLISMRDSFSLDQSKLAEQSRAFMDSARDAFAPRVEQARDVVGSTAGQVRDVVAPRFEQAKEVVGTTAGQVRDVVAPQLEAARDAVGAGVQQVREVVEPRVEQAKEVIQTKAQQVKEVVAPKVEQAQQAVSSQIEQAREVSAAAQIEHAKEVVAETSQQAKDAAPKTLAETKATAQGTADVVAAKAQQTVDAVKPQVAKTVQQTQEVLSPEQARNAARQTVANARAVVEPVAQQAQQSIKQANAAIAEATSAPVSTIERAGPDLTKSVVSESELAASGVVVEEPGLSQSAVVVDPPSADAEFESAWNKATKERNAKSTKIKKPVA